MITQKNAGRILKHYVESHSWVPSDTTQTKKYNINNLNSYINCSVVHTTFSHDNFQK